MLPRRPFVLRHRITGQIKHTTSLSTEDGGMWEVLLTDGSPQAVDEERNAEAVRRISAIRKRPSRK